ncbi:hypothetical protein [Kitasatospora sp. CB02891]|uniref:hypothetical protein n=1 Tax=Kitasatospora sp. CB02891 TaxID=2020329 RepID=UPI0012FD4FB1|nr:hypothetical protein [Kitasatospora sp. CB02891]
MRKIRTLAASGVAAAMITFGVVAATPASAATCTTWHDDATFGVSCDSAGSATYVYATAKCTNGKTVTGAAARIGSGQWSYAYCSSVGAGLSNEYGYTTF